MSYSKKDDDTDESVFAHVDQITVMQEARIFNQSPVSPKKCRALLEKLAYLVYTGEKFQEAQATELFFGITKLFQNKDPSLRQMVYITIKLLSGTAQDLIMITSSIMKDTATDRETVYRPNAIRALVRVIDANTVPAIERIMTTAIVDTISAASAAALVSSYHLFPIAKDIVSRWNNEIQEAVVSRTIGKQVGKSPFFTSSLGYKPSSSGISQYHALGLLYRIRRQDPVSISKLIQLLCGKQGIVSNPHALVMLIRYTGVLLQQSPHLTDSFVPILHGWLKGKSDMVNLEAARTLVRVKGLPEQFLQPVINVLKIFLSSHRSAARFSAICTLSELAMTRPHLVHSCNIDMENLLTDPNRSIASYAITTLLKTGNEESVDRLMQQISGFMSDISDSFKIVVVDAVRSLCLKFPNKYKAMLKFLSSILDGEGTYDYKRSAVDAIYDLMKYIPQSKEKALGELAEFIEDCEYPKLAVRILRILGEEGPKASHPTKYIRYIYNRIMLENAIVRSAAVSALTKFGTDAENEAVRESVKTILSRCLDDADDEVRDRTVLSLKVLDNVETLTPVVDMKKIPSLSALESKLVDYLLNEKFDDAFDLNEVPVLTQDEIDAENYKAKKASTEAVPVEPEEEAAAEVVEKPEVLVDTYNKIFQSIPEFSNYGDILKSSTTPVELTEKETEFVVKTIKHVFKDHLVVEFQLQNTLAEVVLENVVVVSTPSNDDLVEDCVIPAPRASQKEPVSIYVSFSFKEPYPTVTLNNVLKFTSKEVDLHTGELEEEGYEDEYEIDDLEVDSGDYLIPVYEPDFSGAWESLSSSEGSAVYVLSNVHDYFETCERVVEMLQLEPLEGSEHPMEGERVHTLKLSGKTVTGDKVLATVKMARAKDNAGVAVKITAHGESQTAVDLVLSGVA
ncbi:coatomer gamma subunit Sec21 [Schizosaccharomyces japonicus yFS275]|uniref:Coatomer subunit gamma n=1 Tax=Schizosaccharomyces japonicus (strain yFS275 / FY16936) TaxID=402676 RepID=B6JY49_SCHJY|nr:coatomer gamma subunit Sec21 [Schizosaccharomyces japonicus yFS275]EEB06467.1 coatomer gamma subunit Sec21 [Schizosaccharomyces japonicus yFS275]